MTIWPNVLKIGYILYSVSSPALLSLLLLTMTASRTHDLPAIRHLYIPHAKFLFCFVSLLFVLRPIAGQVGFGATSFDHCHSVFRRDAACSQHVCLVRI